MTPTELPAAQPQPAPPATAARQTTHSSSPACATSKAYTRSYPARSASVQYPAQRAGPATSTTPPLISRWPQPQSPPASPPRSSANPRASPAHTPSIRTAPRRRPAIAAAADTPETCSTPDWSKAQKRSAPLPPESSTAAAFAPKNRFAAYPPLRCHAAAIPAPQSSPPPADTDSMETATPGARSNKAQPEACCNPADTAFPEISGNVHSRNKTTRSRDAQPSPDFASPPEYATAQRSPKIMPTRNPGGIPATSATPP